MILLGLLLMVAAGCADRQRRNPLDPDAESPLDVLSPLGALAEDGRVRLQWDLTRLSDLEGLRIYRVGGPEGSEVIELPPSDSVYTDEDVTNGFIYRYSLSMLVKEEGEIFVGDAQLATPGPEISWLADRGSGLVWRLSADGRTGLFAQGRFPSIAAIAVDATSGDCWVSDRRFRSLHRIDSTGGLDRIGADLEAGGDLVIDGPGRRGWVVDRFGFEVYSFGLDAVDDTLHLTEIDATFQDEVELAEQNGSLWIADRQGERVLLYDASGARVFEWQGIEGLIKIDASAGSDRAWILANDGLTLMLLVPSHPPLEIFMPFVDAAVALDVGDVRGDVWVAGPADVVAYTNVGGPILHWDNVSDTRAVAIDERNEHVWFAASTRLWKVSLEAAYQTQLTGFTETVDVVVHSGN